MCRKELITQLNAYKSKWANESETANIIIDFISENPNSFERSLQTGHVTGSAWITNTHGSHVLLSHHEKLNKWLQLGGHSDGDSNILRVSTREAYEESGLSKIKIVFNGIFDIDVHIIPERGCEMKHYHYDIRYAMQAVESDKYTVSNESFDLNWIKITEIQKYTQSASMIRMASNWISALLKLFAVNSVNQQSIQTVLHKK